MRISDWSSDVCSSDLGLKVATIADLISYRRRHDHFVERRLESRFTSRYGGDFKMALYVNTLNYAEHVALWKGDIGGDEPALVRMHAINVLDDVLGDSASGKAGDLQQAMRMIGEAWRGVVVLTIGRA